MFAGGGSSGLVLAGLIGWRASRVGGMSGWRGSRVGGMGGWREGGGWVIVEVVTWVSSGMDASLAASLAAPSALRVIAACPMR